jgi:hypothetical protein
VERWALRDAQTVAEWLHDGFDDFRLSLLSNAGLRLSPVLGHHAPEALAGQVVTRVAPFPIRHRWLDGDRMVLFVRNASVTIRAHRKLPAVLAQLEEGEALSVAGIVTALQPRFREDATLHVLNLLRNLGGIEIVPQAAVEAA